MSRFANGILSKSAIGRREYVIASTVVIGLRLAVDYLVARFVFQQTLPLSYYVKPGFIIAFLDGGADAESGVFYTWMFTVALPFVFVGMLLSWKRAQDVGWNPLLCVFNLLTPLIWILTVTLAAAPQGFGRANSTQTIFEHYVSRNAVKRSFQAIIFSVAVSSGLVIIGTMLLSTYGGILFMGVPFVIGYAAGAVECAHGAERHDALRSSFVSFLLLGFVLMIGGLEGAICLLMAFPIALPFVYIGALSAVKEAEVRGARAAHGTIFMVIALIPVLQLSEAFTMPQPPLRQVTTAVIVNAPPTEVWRNVISFPQLAEPKELMFKAGIAYPINAEIDGRGVGAVRHCNFSTGSFVEPITEWDAPRRLRFSVTKQPPPMHELSPYNIHPRHLDGYLQCEKGQFQLVALPGSRTKLVGTTWYRDSIWPQQYWSIYSDNIIHSIHHRVLSHIKNLAEAGK
ncbi:MAG TPA: hypothetical protein VGK19_04800 [Capsulimonadaceae bacterium]|jgi:hypothetical protein